MSAAGAAPVDAVRGERPVAGSGPPRRVRDRPMTRFQAVSCVGQASAAFIVDRHGSPRVPAVVTVLIGSEIDVPQATSG